MNRFLPSLILSLPLMLTVPACGDGDDESGEATTTTTTTAGDDGDTSGIGGAGSTSTDGDSAGSGSTGGGSTGSGSTGSGSGDDGATGGSGDFVMCGDCESDADCGGEACVADARGELFCSRQCAYFGETACPEGYYCKQNGTTAKDFYCYPLDGICERDGLDCSPCRLQGPANCEAGLFCFEPLGGIGFCVRECDGAGTCPFSGTECGHHDKAENSICLPKIDGVPSAKCGARPLTFCEPCTTARSCETGVCVESENIGQVCSEPCDGGAVCPSGTDCVLGNCVPPIGHGCQGFLSCLGVNCSANEICYKGFCTAAP